MKIKFFLLLFTLIIKVGGEPTNLTNNSAGDFEPMWSPDGKKIAFYSDRNPVEKCKYKILIMDADGSNQKELPNTDCDFRPVWSPDGKKLAFDSGRDGNHEIYTINIDGTDLRRLTNSPNYDSSPRWSPDGKKIVYFSGSTEKDYGNSEIYIMNTDGTGKENLTIKEGSDTYPFFSPDGKKIAFTSYRDGNAEIYVMDADGSNQQRLTNNSARDDNARWSPDGKQIGFGTDRDGYYEVYVMDSDGQNKQNISQNPSNDVDISWSPNGNQITFASKRTGNYEIFLMENPQDKKTVEKAKSGKIPVTSKSKEALEFYKKGFELENKLETDIAETAYKEAIKLDSTFALAYIRLGMLRDNYDARRNYIAEAMKYLDKVSDGERLWILGRNAFYGIGKDEDEHGFFEKLVKLYPEDEQANYIYGYLNHHHGVKDLQKAIFHLEKSIKINPKYALPYNDLAYTYMEKNDFENAERIIQSYIKLLPEQANPYDTYAEMLMRTGQYIKSIEMYEKVLSINPIYSWAIMGKAANLNFLNRHTEARKILLKLNKIKLGDYEDRHKWRSNVISFVDEGKLGSAIEVLKEQYKDADERNNLTMQYESLSRIVRLHFENKQPTEGLKAYKNLNTFAQTKLSNEDTKKRVLHVGIYYDAYAAYLRDDFDLAKELLAKFESENGSPTDESKILMVFMLIKGKKYDSALEVIKTVDLENPYNIFWMAEVYKLKGDKTAAEKWFGKVATKLEMNNLDYALVRGKTEKRIYK